MDILSFVLGIAVVLIIGLSVIAVIAFVKARKTEKELESVSMFVYQQFDKIQAELHRRIDELGSDVFSQLDSRLDKLENKLTTKK